MVFLNRFVERAIFPVGIMYVDTSRLSPMPKRRPERTRGVRPGSEPGVEIIEENGILAFGEKSGSGKKRERTYMLEMRELSSTEGVAKVVENNHIIHTLQDGDETEVKTKRGMLPVAYDASEYRG